MDDFASAGAATNWLTTEYQVLTAAVALAADASLELVRHAASEHQAALPRPDVQLADVAAEQLAAIVDR